MLKNISDAFSRAWHGRKTASKQLDVIIRAVELWPAGHEYEGVKFLVPFYHLSLDCSEKALEVPVGGGGHRTTMSGFEAIIAADSLDQERLKDLVPGAQVAVKGELCADGKGWGTAFVTHDGLGLWFYELSDLAFGKAENPVNPAEVLVPFYTYPVKEPGAFHLPDCKL